MDNKNLVTILLGIILILFTIITGLTDVKAEGLILTILLTPAIRLVYLLLGSYLIYKGIKKQNPKQ